MNNKTNLQIVQMMMNHSTKNVSLISWVNSLLWSNTV